MIYNGDANKQDCVSEILKICDATLATYSIYDITRRFNASLDSFYSIALTSDGSWQIDDANYSDLPIGLTNLVAGQQDYSFAADVLMLTKLLAQDEAGNWRTLRSVDQDDEASKNIWELPPGNQGIPTKYDILGNSIFLDPIPNYSKSNGLKAIFKRSASKFTITDTAKEPGIPSIFHPYLCRQTALPFLVEKKLPQKKDIFDLIQIDEQRIQDFFGKRDGTRETRFIPKYRSSR